MGLISRVSSRTYRYKFFSFPPQKMGDMIDFKAVAEQFTGYYYQLFATDRNQLTALYTDESCLTFEGDQKLGKAAIVEKLGRLSFSKVQHKITKIDSQPVIGIDNNKAVFVQVIGKLVTDDDPEKGFVQSFLLRPVDADASGFFIANETFRLALFD